jgi:hypothetical protein
MTPLIIYAFFAGIMGFCIHKKWYGGAAFAGAMLIWMMLMQLIIAYSLHPIAN